MTGTGAAIFDVDGVLLSSPHERAWREALDGFADASRFMTLATLEDGEPMTVIVGGVSYPFARGPALGVDLDVVDPEDVAGIAASPQA